MVANLFSGKAAIYKIENMPIIDTDYCRVKFTNPDQILNMGGPWVGDFFCNDLFISNNVIIDNVLCDKSSEKVFFIKYHFVSKRRAKENYFTINYFDVRKKCICEFKKKFEMLFLNSLLSENEIEIFMSFNNKNEKKRMVFYVVDEPKLTLGCK